MEPYNAIDLGVGWKPLLRASYSPLSVCPSHKKGILYPILSIIRRGARKKMLFIKS